MDSSDLPPQKVFPLEPVAVFAGREKMTSDTSYSLRYWAHLHLTRRIYHSMGVMLVHEFDEVHWRLVYDAMHNVPDMFGIWACKQVNDIAPTNYNQSVYNRSHDPLCPSCGEEDETCAHILFCDEAGRVDNLLRSLELVNRWLMEVGTDPSLRRCIMEFARNRSGMSMIEITRAWGPRFSRLAASQDTIGWRRFMEGMISKEWVKLQAEHYTIHGGRYDPNSWAKQFSFGSLQFSFRERGQ